MHTPSYYEVLLQKQCDTYTQMLNCITQIDSYDDALYKATIKKHAHFMQVQRINACKEQLVQNLDTLSLHAETMEMHVSQMAESVSAETQPDLYHQMRSLQFEIDVRLRMLLEKEDTQNPLITQKLALYQDSVKLDQAISEVPLKKRKLFFLFPKH